MLLAAGCSLHPTERPYCLAWAAQGQWWQGQTPVEAAASSQPSLPALTEVHTPKQGDFSVSEIFVISQLLFNIVDICPPFQHDKHWRNDLPESLVCLIHAHNLHSHTDLIILLSRSFARGGLCRQPSSDENPDS